jgi:GT2 family glycosyltransferase
MPTANPLLIQVVSQLKPERCGVSDHAILLARELESAFGIRTAFVVLNSTEPCDLPFPRVDCAPSQLPESCISLSKGQPSAILVHYSGYGYSADGAPHLLAEAVERVRASGQFRIGVYFHELFATGMPWSSAFWHTHRQRRVVRRLAQACDLIATNSSRQLDWLEREAIQSRVTQVRLLPVFSNVGESMENPSMSARRPAMVVFGLPATRRRAYGRLSSLGGLLRSLGIEEIVDAGPEFDSPSKLCGIPVRRMGVMAAADLAGILSQSLFGFVWHNSFGLANSGVFAGLCAFGAIPVIAEPFAGEVDGLRDGVHLISPRTAGAVMAGALQSCSAAAWQWYSGHRLHLHAATYSRLLMRTPNEAVPGGGKPRQNAFEENRPLTVGICIGTYNQAQYLSEAVASALAQSYPVQGVWVSDDASSDQTEQVMAKICAESPTVHYFRHPKNLGISRNFSWVLAQPQTDLIVRLDSDDRLETDYVEILAALMAKYPSAGFAHSDVFEMDGNGKRTRVRRLARLSEFESADEALRRSAAGFRSSANLLLYRASALAQAQYYLPTADWRACEDWNLCVRIAANGWGNVFAPRPLASYRIWNDALGTRAARKIEEISNILSTYENTLMPEYLRRGWDTAILRKNMRRKAVSYADAIGSTRFSDAERKIIKGLLRKLGGSFSLSLAIFLAEMGFNPVCRCIRMARMRAKDLVKSCLRAVRSYADDREKIIKTHRGIRPARFDEDKR